MSSGDFSKPIQLHFGYILKRAQQTLRTRMDLQLRAHELTLPQFAVLSAVAVSPGISNADLAKEAFVTPQTMQGIISTLEKRGLLKRSQDPDHGRRLMAQLTENGRNAIKTVEAEILKVEALMIGSISSSEVKQATETLLKCIENLTEK